eukprot:CAMPEP_0172521702 /NCGR_PEP_ID=MMETSP1066-20121228/292730_1 /TAXON_ID=671091 /ORGANISM="Coscinodiscus wailesii, Strain CCMP2513" /LENGTH=386 /DNA_ID=CAMNT_0013304651 /DNA_START=79 /DNA_END=1240 /DNA_ORIENTATION=-
MSGRRESAEPTLWLCDYCKIVKFDTFEKAVAHEAKCSYRGAAHSGGGHSILRSNSVCSESTDSNRREQHGVNRESRRSRNKLKQKGMNVIRRLRGQSVSRLRGSSGKSLGYCSSGKSLGRGSIPDTKEKMIPEDGDSIPGRSSVTLPTRKSEMSLCNTSLSSARVSEKDKMSFGFMDHSFHSMGLMDSSCSSVLDRSCHSEILDQLTTSVSSRFLSEYEIDNCDDEQACSKKVANKEDDLVAQEVVAERVQLNMTKTPSRSQQGENRGQCQRLRQHPSSMGSNGVALRKKYKGGRKQRSVSTTETTSILDGLERRSSPKEVQGRARIGVPSSNTVFKLVPPPKGSILSQITNSYYSGVAKRYVPDKYGSYVEDRTKDFRRRHGSIS